MILQECPARVDLAGGWLDVPAFALAGGFVVNCAITPMFTADPLHNPYTTNSGIGGSAAMHILRGVDAVQAELDSGVGWQDPAIIQETGLCVWYSGARPRLCFKCPGLMLAGRMALWHAGKQHVTSEIKAKPRELELIKQASIVAAKAVAHGRLYELIGAINMTQQLQLAEGMASLGDTPYGCVARKYCGSGWGGYVLLMFNNSKAREIYLHSTEGAMAIEPYCRPPDESLSYANEHSTNLHSDAEQA